MKILITGGQGYIARNLKPFFENMGDNVIAPSRTELDLLNFEFLSDYMYKEKFDAVIHTATRGGKRTKKDTFEEVFIPNLRMFENITAAVHHYDIPIITFGSGAEFDRQFPIENMKEEDVVGYWPYDPYGLSKNIITRQVLADYNNVWVLRLFGCFNYDEDNTRFIKNSILNLKRGLPIEIHQNRRMDFFYLDDIFLVIDHILHHGGPRNINLVYDSKIDLLSIASIIHKHCGLFKHPIKLIEMGNNKSYTGDGTILSKLPIFGPLLGLEEGIRRTCNKLL